MKPERAFVAERLAAQHCAELLRSGPDTAELIAALARLGARLARLLAPALAPLCGNEPPVVRCLPPREIDMATLVQEVAALAANSLLIAGTQDSPLLASIDAATILRLVDRSFGGRGETTEPLPDSFALSAELMIARIETVLVAQLSIALGSDSADAVRALRRDGSLAALAPFAPASRLAVLELDICDNAASPWTIQLAFPFDTIAALLGHGDKPRTAHTGGPRAANPAAEPYAAIPLPLTAVLVDMAMPMATLALLEPGQIIPVAVARNVPLRIGGRTIAHGAVGAQDDRVALQITQIC